MTEPGKIPDDVRVYGVEGGGVEGVPNDGGGHVCGDINRYRRERDYRWYCRRGTDISGR